MRLAATINAAPPGRARPTRTPDPRCKGTDCIGWQSLTSPTDLPPQGPRANNKSRGGPRHPEYVVRAGGERAGAPPGEVRPPLLLPGGGPGAEGLGCQP